MTSLFIGLLSQRRAEIRHPDPVAAIEWCFTIVYSVIARRLGLGSTMEGANDAGDWDELDRRTSPTLSPRTCPWLADADSFATHTKPVDPRLPQRARATALWP